ncbi:hypothetical protein [Bowmanella dokdonensis]|uniref:DNA polymerase III subunit psi n=1 Tax=Bowmanella dokdonensis TaxID=751969 RepID=A0A939DM73_9ALTE|nr:hypothetical protein [Bowmanella dokdonensis]MBN7824817.1 hypothetical protein [Bowmanella dokdonensis]
MKSITPYQQAILAEMGIVQYRLRQPPTELAAEAEPTPAHPKQAVAAEQPTPQAIANHPMWQDIQQALLFIERSAEVTWHVADDICFDGQTLKCPAPSTLSTQPGLKRALWQALQLR